jgi:uracil phosphoribosyltransferase
VIGATEGIQKIKSKYPYLTIIIAAEDSALNDKKFIVPGLGDFGDRYFGN